MAKDSLLSISVDSQKKLTDYIKATANMRTEMWNFRGRLEDIDRAYARENDYTEDQWKSKRANKMNDPTKLQNLKVPLVMESVETTVSFLTQVFLTEYPMFRFGTSPEYEDLALMWNTLVGEDQVRFNWVGEFAQAFRQGSKYNFAAIEVTWERQIKYISENANAQGGTKLKEIVCEGNRIKSLDSYNVIYDPRVPAHKVHELGEFVGYIEPMSRIRLKRFLMSLGEDRLKNDVKAFQAPDWDVDYYIPQINLDVVNNTNSKQLNGQFNWVAWATDSAKSHIQYRDSYTTVILYARIMPAEFGIQAPNDNTPDIWKLITVNGVLVYAQPVPNSHDYLPIIIAQPLVDNIGAQTKSQAENQQPFQEMATSMTIAAQNVARRMVTDRMLYNPLLVDPDHINSPNPSAKIPIRPTAYGRKLEEAVHQIPFNANGTEMFMQQAQMISQWGMRANGQNLPSVGQFQKGNKLQDEWQTTMANANAKERTQAINWESFCLQPIKEILKSNYLQFTPTGERYNRQEQQTVTVDIAKLREVVGEFEVGDGLQPIDKKLHTDVLQASFQLLMGSPQLQQEYEMGPMFAYLMQMAGADKLAKFKKAPEQVTYEQQMSMYQNTVAMLSKMKKEDYTPEEISKIIGPMPQPPAPANTQPANPDITPPSA